MISCKEVQEIHASGKELNLWQKFKYKVHVFICHNCQKIQSQYEIINRKIRGIPDPEITENDQSNIENILKNIKR